MSILLSKYVISNLFQAHHHRIFNFGMYAYPLSHLSLLLLFSFSQINQLSITCDHLSNI